MALPEKTITLIYAEPEDEKTATDPIFTYKIPANFVPNYSLVTNASLSYEDYAWAKPATSKVSIVSGGPTYTSTTFNMETTFTKHEIPGLKDYFQRDGKERTINITIKGSWRNYKVRKVTLTVTYIPPSITINTIATEGGQIKGNVNKIYPVEDTPTVIEFLAEPISEDYVFQYWINDAGQKNKYPVSSVTFSTASITSNETVVNYTAHFLKLAQSIYNLFLGNKPIKGMYIGQTQVSRIYLGNKEIFKVPKNTTNCINGEVVGR